MKKKSVAKGKKKTIAAKAKKPATTKAKKPAKPKSKKAKKKKKAPIVHAFDFLSTDYQLGYSDIEVTGREETSDNWSGIAVIAKTGQPFDYVHGEWKIPDMTPPASPPTPADDTHALSIWIGCDGHNATTLSMPQIGTTQAFKDDGMGNWQAYHYAWWQWWGRGIPTKVNHLNNVALGPGYRVSCRLKRTSPTTATVTIQATPPNGPAQAPYSVNIAAPVDKNGNVMPAYGTSAEWIAERPTRPPKWLLQHPTVERWGMLFPLPDFEPFKFRRCRARSTAAAVTRHLLPSRSIRMMDAILGPPPACSVLSRAKVRTRDPTFRSFWVGPGVM